MSNLKCVIVLDKNKQPLMPCHPARARQLLRQGKAAIYSKSPFTIILQERERGEIQPELYEELMAAIQEDD